MWNALTRFTDRLSPNRRRCRTLDDDALLEHLADGWPVWRIAKHYRASAAEIRQAIGRAVTRASDNETVFGAGCRPTGLSDG